MASEADIQSILDDARVQQDVPGLSAVVIREGEILFVGGSGVVDLESKRAADADTVYYIGSVTKVLTTVLALQLIDQSIIGLDDVIPGMGTEAVTVKHLLTHASGLEREGNFDYWFTADFPDQEELADYLEHAPLRAAPGSQLHYSNVGFAALGKFLGESVDQTYDAALRERVLEPLQMHSSGSPGPAPDVATAYSPRGSLVPNDETPFAGVGKSVDGRHVRMYHDAKSMTPAFGAYSNVRDLGRLGEFLLGSNDSDVVSVAGRKSMRQRQATGRGLGMGMRRENGRLLMSHGGWFAAYRSHLLLNTGDNIVIAVLTNSDSATPKIIADRLHQAVVDQFQ